MFVSDLGTAPIVGDHNWRDFVKPLNGDGVSESGFISRDLIENPFGCYEGSSSFPSELLYDEKQIKEIIEEQERNQTSLKHIIDRAPPLWLNQSPTNYCWCYAVVHGVMIVRLVAGYPLERLSPYSAACIIKNFKNNGGWGSQALTHIVKYGVASEKFWPMETPEMSSGQRESANMNAIRNGRQYLESSRADAARHVVTEFYELRPRNWLEKLSCLVRRMPVPSGYNWMGHEMCSIRAVILPNGQLGCEDMDHYGSKGKYNSRIMTQSRGTADDQVVPLVSPPAFAA